MASKNTAVSASVPRLRRARQRAWRALIAELLADVCHSYRFSTKSLHVEETGNRRSHGRCHNREASSEVH